MSAAEDIKVLGDHLRTLSAVTSIEWPNQEFTPVAGEIYVSVSFFRNDPQRLTISGHHRYPGIMQAIVMAPEGVGSPKADKLADKIAAHFPADLRVTSDDGIVRVQRAPQIARGFAAEGRWQVPVSIYFERLS